MGSVVEFNFACIHLRKKSHSSPGWLGVSVRLHVEWWAEKRGPRDKGPDLAVSVTRLFCEEVGGSKVWVCLSLMPAKIQLFPPRHTSSTSRGVLRDLAISRVGGLYSPLKINPSGQPMPGLTPCYARVRLSGGMCRAVTHYIPPLQHHTSRPAGGIPQTREIIEEDNGEMSSFLRSPTSLCLF